MSSDLGGVLTAIDKNKGAKNPKNSNWFLSETIIAVTIGSIKSETYSLFRKD